MEFIQSASVEVKTLLGVAKVCTEINYNLTEQSKNILKSIYAFKYFGI